MFVIKREYSIDNYSNCTPTCPIMKHIQIGSVACQNCKYFDLDKDFTIYCKQYTKIEIE
jgi:hypothetical protein